MSRRRPRFHPAQPSMFAKAAIAGPFVRHCRECGAVLSRANLGTICAPCVAAEVQEAKTKVYGLAEMGISE